MSATPISYSFGSQVLSRPRWFRLYLGPTLLKKETDVIEDGDKTGKGSTREANEFRVHPDIVKELNIGQALFLGLGPRKFHLLNLRNPEKTVYVNKKDKNKERASTPSTTTAKKSEKDISFQKVENGIKRN